MSIDSEERLEWALGYLEGKAYFSSPNNFNDPFELSAVLFPPSDEEIDHVAKQHNHNYKKLSKSKRQKLRRKVRLDLAKSENVVSTEEWLKDIGVLCLTEKPTNKLMWAHYADCHKGVCFGFDSGASIFKNFEKVSYAMVRPNIHYSARSNISDGDLKNVLFTKSCDWSYEEEWRGIRRTVREDEKRYYKSLYDRNELGEDEIVEALIENSGPGVYDFDISSIRRIYLGARIESINKELIVNRINRLGLKVKVFQLTLDMKHFVLCENEVA